MYKHALLLFCTLSLSHCAHFHREVPSPVSEASEFQHTVRYSGESLWDIAKWYTGKGNLWTRLSEKNKEINPKALRLGDLVVIPNELLIRTDPFPKPRHQFEQTRHATLVPAAAAPEQFDGPEMKLELLETESHPLEPERFPSRDSLWQEILPQK